MKNLLFLFCCFVAQISWTQTSQNFQLKGKLIDLTDDYKASSCGFIGNAFCFKFEIISLSKADYKEKTIPIIIMCLEMFDENFISENAMYEMNIQIGFNFDGVIFNSELNDYNAKKSGFWLVYDQIKRVD